MDRRAPGLRALVRPRAVAVVGASADPAKAGYQMLATLTGFPGRLHAVNPGTDEILGITAHDSVVEIPSPVDLAVLTVPAGAVPAVMEDCAAAGVGAAIVCSGGFAERGLAGVALQDEVAAIARKAGIRLLGPNTSGLVAPAAGLYASFVSGVRVLRPGGLAIVAQSGGVHHALAFAAHRSGLGLRIGMGLGNAADVSFADVLEHLAEDAGTTAVALHIEGLDGGARRVVAAVGRLTQRVPVIALVVGRADVGAFARSHTGALVADRALTRAALTQAGAVVVDDTDELVQAADVLTRRRLHPVATPGVAVVSGQAGPALLATDLLRHAGVAVPPLSAVTRQRLAELLGDLTYQANPVDTGRPGPTFGAVLRAVAADPAIDVVLAYALLEPGTLNIDDVAAAARDGLPLVFATAGPPEQTGPVQHVLTAAGIPVAHSPEAGARAVRDLVADARARARRADGAPVVTPDPGARPRGCPAEDLDEVTLKRRLAAAGIAVPAGTACTTHADAHRALAELGGPVVVKILTPVMAHKSDAGGVHLGIGDAAALDTALAALDAIGATSYLVEAQAGPGAELIVGATYNPTFGPTVLVGLGGVTAEAVGDVSVGLAPLTRAEAREMLDALQGRRLLTGFRGLPAADPTAVADVVVAVGQILSADPTLCTVEINPLRLTASGPVALDAFAEPAADPRPAQARSARAPITVEEEDAVEGVRTVPRDLADRYRREGYWRGETLGALLRTWAADHGDRCAIVGADRRLSYVELDREVDRVAHGLSRLGVGAGDRVVLHLPNIPEFPITAFALMRLGALPVFALPDHRELELSHFVEVAQATAMVIPREHRGFDEVALARKLRAAHGSLRHVVVVGAEPGSGITPFADLARDVDDRTARDTVESITPDPSDVAFFLLSGGTTGLPKLIPRTHDDYAYNVRASAELCGFDRDTIYLVALPIAHNFPWGCPGTLGALHAGGTAVLAPSPSPEVAFPLIAAEGVTATALVPAVAIRWMDTVEAGTDHNLSSLQLLQVGGARLNAEAARRVRPLLGCTLQQVFGMAEGLLNYTRLDDPEEVIIATQGRPLSPADEVRIVDEDGHPADSGATGRLQTRGPYTIHGWYYAAPEDNARSFTPDGFYESGDAVAWHPSGNLNVQGRVKDFINRGGEKFSTEEIENHILAHPAVANVAVVAMPDRELGDRACAYVVTRPGRVLHHNELEDFLSRRGLARFKIPDRLELTDALPLTLVGKVSRVELRKDIARKLAEEGHPNGS